MTNYDITKADHFELERFVDVVAGQLAAGVISTEMALYGLYDAACELNRRHGHASIQTEDDADNALDILNDVNQLLDTYDGDEHIDWTFVRQQEARAYGVLLDRGTEDRWSALVAAGGPDAIAVRDYLYDLACSEGARRGYDHRVPAVLVPADDPWAPPF